VYLFWLDMTVGVGQEPATSGGVPTVTSDS